MSDKNQAPEGAQAGVMRQALEALEKVNKQVSAGAGEGFNCHAGDWAEKLFESQRDTSDAIRAIRAALAAPPTDNNSMGKSGCFPAAERTNAAHQAAPSARELEFVRLPDGDFDLAPTAAQQTKEPTHDR